MRLRPFAPLRGGLGGEGRQWRAIHLTYLVRQFLGRWQQRRQDRGNRDKVLLLNIGIAQGMFERRELMAMPARAAR
jgi:hypothetical protein